MHPLLGHDPTTKVNRQTEAMKPRQQKIKDLTGRVIRLDGHLELLTSAAMVKRLQGPQG